LRLRTQRPVKLPESWLRAGAGARRPTKHAAASTAARIEEAIAIPLRTVARRRGASTFLISLRTSARIGAISGRSRSTAVATRDRQPLRGSILDSRASVPTKAFTIGPPGRVITPTTASVH
jgi:hypothetical protein